MGESYRHLVIRFVFSGGSKLVVLEGIVLKGNVAAQGLQLLQGTCEPLHAVLDVRPYQVLLLANCIGEPG